MGRAPAQAGSFLQPHPSFFNQGFNVLNNDHTAPQFERAVCMHEIIEDGPQTSRQTSHKTGLFRNEEGGILVLFAILLIPMLLFIGFSIELALTEYRRTQLQSTTDTASLAAADLQQTLDSRSVVEDYFERAGLLDKIGLIDVVEDDNGRSVEVTAQTSQRALLTSVAGFDDWQIPVEGTAVETVGDIEIALVLDNSTSMSWAPGAITGPPATPSRMDLLIPAAEQFVDLVQPQPGERGTTTISFIPFATQVSLGPDFLGFFNVTDEHAVSDCVTFPFTADYASPVISRTNTLFRTAHHDNRGNRWGLTRDWTICPTSADRDILPWSENAGIVKQRIRDMEPYGLTSIEIGAKWGAALLDPSLRPVLSGLSSVSGYEYLSAGTVRGVPLDYTAPTARKYLVIMSDGENTRNSDIREPYRTGLSPLYRLPGNNEYAYFRDRSGSADFFRVELNEDDGGDWIRRPSGATQMTWQEVWAEMTVDRFIEDIRSRADGINQTNDSIRDEIVYEREGAWKNNRTNQICTAAKNAGVTIFTIGMDTYGLGDTTLRNCASSTTTFYDIDGLDIAKAFEAIARQINQLRLTQ